MSSKTKKNTETPFPHKVYADDDLKVGIFISSTATWNNGAKIILRNMFWELICMKPNPFSDITIMTQQQAIFFGLTLHVIIIILMVLTTGT